VGTLPPLEQSILRSTKKLVNIDMDDPSFDHDVITHINTAFFHLHQLGVGPQAGFAIEDEQAKWSDFLGEGAPTPLISAVKTNVALRVRAIFDPPTLPHVMKAMESQITESDVRINTLREETEWVHPDPIDLLIVDGGDPSGE
jgi:hypothetical protein